MAALTPAEVVSRHALAEELKAIDEAELEWLRTAILERQRLDVLAERVLGLKLERFHKAMQRHVLRHPHSLQLAFRGGGKTTCVTVTYIIFRIIVDRNTRVLIASKTHKFAKDILKEIKAHLEGNELLVRLFGNFVGEKWDSIQIEVDGRNRPMKEPTITTVGSEGQVVGMHYDLIMGDDLVDESNARTRYMRDTLQTFFYKTLMPTLEPDGELHILGTRYHYDDLYGHLESHEMAEHTQVITALDSRGRSPWPSKYGADYFKELRKKLGTIAFNSQYQCDTEAMRGEVFDYDWMIECAPGDVPAGAKVFMGVDLAISERETSDCFAIVVVAVLDRMIYVTHHYEGHLTFGKQVRMITAWYDQHDPVAVAVESNAYQAALAQHLKETRPDMRVRKVITRKDKVTRAWKQAQRFESEEVRIVRGQQRLIEHLVAFPGGRFKDLFDALDLAITAAFKKRKRRRRTSEPGVL